MEMFNKIADVVMAEHEGAVAFEYIIVLVIMAVALFIGFRMLQAQLIGKSNDIFHFIRNNGQSTLHTGNPIYYNKH